jgi:predicted CXXCH cytochrome family protein
LHLIDQPADVSVVSALTGGGGHPEGKSRSKKTGLSKTAQHIVFFKDKKRRKFMKKFIVVAVCLVLGMFLVASMAMATDYSGTVTPGNGIKGTAHDLSLIGAGTAGRTDLYGSNDTNNAYGGGDLDRICIWCHTPHFSLKNSQATGYGYLPLWNHGVTSLEYAMYTNGPDEPADTNHASEAEKLLAGVKVPGGVSRLCLSCHDGSVAVNAYGRMADGTGPGDDKSTGGGWGALTAEYIKADYMIGGDGTIGDLSNHHPIGFVYDDVEKTDDEIQVKTASFVGTYTIGDLLWSGKMECTTCHDVHNTKNTGEKFLWKSDAQSALCLTCHLKADVKK